MKRVICTIVMSLFSLVSTNSQALTIIHAASLQVVSNTTIYGGCLSTHYQGYAYKLWGDCYLYQGTTLKEVEFHDVVVDGNWSNIVWTTEEVPFTCNCFWKTVNKSRYVNDKNDEYDDQGDGVAGELFRCQGGS